MVTPQFFEPAVIAALEPRIGHGFQFVDVGANVGFYSLLVAQRALDNAKVLAIEPQPELCLRLRENIVLNGFDVTIAQTAVSDFNGQVSLTVDHKNLGGTGITADHLDRHAAEKIEVPCRKLADLIAENGFERIDAMKVDIEGHEARALRPFFAEAPKSLWPKLLIIETHRTPETRRLIHELKAAGWSDLNSSAYRGFLVRPEGI
jgi:FkbM family methyltransferase